MTYAYHAESHERSNIARITLLDQLYSGMDVYDTRWINMVPWVIDTIISNGGQYRDHDSFLGLATLFNLTGYVSEKLGCLAASATTEQSELATTLLRLFLHPNESWRLPLPGTEMLSLLLNRGANPNGCGGSLNGCASSSP